MNQCYWAVKTETVEKIIKVMRMMHYSVTQAYLKKSEYSYQESNVRPSDY